MTLSKGATEVIQQCAELGQYYQDKESVATDPLLQYAQDPGQKFGKRVLLLQFSTCGFQDVIISEYKQSDRLRFLYRAGAANQWDATPTSGMPSWKPNESGDFENNVGKRLRRLGKAIESALAAADADVPPWETPALNLMSQALLDSEQREAIVAVLKQRHPSPGERAFLSVSWTAEAAPRFVGDFKTFQRQLTRVAIDSRSRGTASTKVAGVGTCAICGSGGINVTEPPSIYWPPLYTRDKPGSIAGGFDVSRAWQNWPTCGQCYERIDFARERIKEKLSFKYYGFKYLALPSVVTPKPSEFFEFLDRLDNPGLGKAASKKLISAEDDLAYVVAEEKNRLQLDLLFFKSDPQSFRPVLYVAGMVPSRFRELLSAKEEVERHPWCRSPSPEEFYSGPFTFGDLHDALYSGHKGTDFDDDFLGATRAALEKRPAPRVRLLAVGMRWIREDQISGRYWLAHMAHLFRTLLFFEKLAPQQRETTAMTVNYGDSDQAERVRQLFEQAQGKLRSDPSAQAAFLIGACCGRIETIQNIIRGYAPYSSNAPFSSKLKGFRLSEPDVRRLFRDAKDKAAAYGEEHETKVAGLLQCAAAALMTAPDSWNLSPDEISYFVALGHALRSRTAKGEDEAAAAQNS